MTMNLSAESWEQNIAQQARSGRIKRLYALWESLATTEPPSLRELMAAGLSEMAAHYAILVPDNDGWFTYMHYGRALMESTGVDRTGTSTGDVAGGPRDYLGREYRRALEGGRPIYIVNIADAVPDVDTWERLVVPVRTGGDLRLLVVLAEPHQLHDSLSSAILEASPDAIIALRAVEDDLGTVYDARILAANESACRMMRRSREQLLHCCLLQLFPRMRDNGMWEQCCEVLESRRSSRFDINLGPGGAIGQFRITLFPLQGGFVMMLQDIADLSGDAIPLIRRRVSNIQHFPVNGY